MEAQLSDIQLRTMRVITLALSFGMVVYAGVFIIIAQSPSEPTSDSSSLLPMLRIAHILVTLVAVFLAKFLSSRILYGSSTFVGRPGVAMTPAMRYKVSLIVQLALFEGCALFGGVVFLTAAIGGALATDPTYYLHLLTIPLFLGFAVILYPTREKFQAIFAGVSDER